MIASVYGFHPYLATIANTGQFRGQVRIEVPAYKLLHPAGLASWMLYGLAGIAAQERYSRLWDASLLGGQEDLEKFEEDWYKLSALTDGRCGFHEDFSALTYTVVKQYWYAIRHFAHLLLEHRTISGDELSEILANVICTSEYKCPPPLDDVCPSACGAWPFRSFSELAARGNELRAQAELEARSYEVNVRAELQARIKALRAGAK